MAQDAESCDAALARVIALVAVACLALSWRTLAALNSSHALFLRLCAAAPPGPIFRYYKLVAPYNFAEAPRLFALCALAMCACLLSAAVLTSAPALACLFAASWLLAMHYIGHARRLSSQVNGHKSFLLIHALALCALHHASGAPPGVLTSALRTLVCLCYFSSGLCKVRCVLRGVLPTAWLSGEALRCYLLLYGATHYHNARLAAARAALVRRPGLCCVFALGALAFELVLPLLVLAGAVRGWVLAGAACLFHAGVWTCQGINFLSFWLPFALAALAFEAAPPAGAALVRAPLVVLYVAVQAAVVAAGSEALMPFSCVSVFSRGMRLADLASADFGFVDAPALTDRVGVDHGCWTAAHLSALPYRVALVSHASGLLTNVHVTSDLSDSAAALRRAAAAGDVDAILTAQMQLRDDLRAARACEAASLAHLVDLAQCSAAQLALDEHGMPAHHKAT